MAKGYYEREQDYLERLWEGAEGEPYPQNPEVDDDDESLVGDHVETLDHNTDSEQEFDEHSDDSSTDSYGLVGPVHRIPCFLGRDKKTRWKKHVKAPRAVRTRAQNIVTQLPGVKGVARQRKEPLEIWSLFFTADLLELIVENTNKYIISKAYNPSYRTARNTDVTEIKALLGLLYISAANKSNNQNASDLFRANGLSMEIYRLTMSLERFRFLLRNLRFDDKITREDRRTVDKLAAIREFFDKFTAELPKHYSMSHFTTIDEMLLGFRGRCGFRVYMPNKPRKYGIKVYALTDARMFYTTSMEVYVGKQPNGPYFVDRSNMAMVPRLCEPIRGTKRNVTMDNFFTSTDLANKLLNDYQLTILGTLRKNKNVIPSEFVNTIRPVGSSMFGFQENLTLVSYIPRKNKNVLLISSMHFSDDIDETTGKPEINIDYNKTKSGVDVVDKLSAAYNCARATCRWPMVLFYGAMNVAGINSYIIYTCNNTNEKNIARRVFLEQLGYDLLKDHIMRRAQQENIPRRIRFRLAEICSLQTGDQEPRRDVHGRCNYCTSKKNRKTRYRCYQCPKFMCLEHLTPICKECSSQIITDD